MNWKNVLYLLRIERKSGRLIRGIKTTRYRENTFLAYWPYWVALIIGVVGGLIANFVVSSVYTSDAIANLPSLKVGTLSVFVILPTIVLVFSFVFTLLQQIQACRNQSDRSSYVLAADNVAGTNISFHSI